MVKSNGSGGNIDSQAMLGYISDAQRVSGIFNTKDLAAALPSAFADRLASYGYFPYEEISHLLKLNGVFSGSFWEDIAKKAFDTNDK